MADEQGLAHPSRPSTVTEGDGVPSSVQHYTAKYENSVTQLVCRAGATCFTQSC